MINIKTLKQLLTIFLLSLLTLSILRFEGIKTDILQAFLNENKTDQSQLLKLSKIFSSNINIIIEADTEEQTESIKQELLEKISGTNLKTESSKYDDLIELYKNYPESFLSEHTRNLLKQKQYSKAAKEAQERLFNPLGIMLQTPDKDPYLLSADYLLSLQNNKTTFQNNKYYQKLSLTLTDKKTINTDLKTITNFHPENGSIYISGSPVHTYKTATKSALEINIICLISTILLVVLCKLYFNSYKTILPIGLSILTGFSTGLLTTVLLFKQLHILTLVFGTSLIGISLDYSLHYINAKINNKNITKELTVSMLTTVIAFLILTLSDVELIKQIGIFTASGLIGVYTFVTLMFSKFELPNINNPLKYFTVPKVIICFVILSVLGIANIKFNDDIKSFYTPEKELLKSEQMNSEIFNTKSLSFITIKEPSINANLEQESKIKEELNSQNINSISITNFIPQPSAQKENRTLVKELYNKNLDNYAKFLSKEQIQNLKTNIKTPKNLSEISLVKQFSIDENTTYLVAFGTPHNIEYINLTADISKIIKNIRLKCLKLLPIVFLVYFAVLAACYKPKKAFKIILNPTLASVFAIVIVSLFGQDINVFHILSIFLILGFSLDYAIFMANGGKTSKDSVFISFITSFISFMLLSFTSFKLISSMGLVISIGLATSYILSSALFSDSQETETK